MAMAHEGNELAIKAVEKAPKLKWPHYLSAYSDLGTERQEGMSKGPIPRSKIKEYAVDEWELSPREAQAFVHIIRTLDIHRVNKQAERDNKSQ